jgi:hypothetical protein
LRYVLDLDGDERVVIRLLKALCKQLGRRFGVKVRRIAESKIDG